MAKNNINLGTLVGKLGDNVFWRTAGQQRVRAYFKREKYAVNSKQALQQAIYANALAVYQYLPPAFKRANNSYRVGESSFSTFMKQIEHNANVMHKGRSGFGRFDTNLNGDLYNLSVGTLPIDTSIKQITWVAADEGVDTPTAYTGIRATLNHNESVKDLSMDILSYNNMLREGDILHFLLGYATYRSAGWNGPFSIGLAPSPWLIRSYGYLQLSLSNNTPASQTLGSIYFWNRVMGGEDVLTFGSNANIREKLLTGEQEDNMIAAFMVERPGNQRTQRFTPSVLTPKTQQPEGGTAYANYYDQAVDSYLKQ